VKEIWLIVKVNNNIYSSLCVYSKNLKSIKQRFLSQLKGVGKIEFDIVSKEPFHGW